MSQVYLIACPSCGFEFPVDDILLQAAKANAHCPRCHHEWTPEKRVPLGLEEAEG